MAPWLLSQCRHPRGLLHWHLSRCRHHRGGHHRHLPSDLCLARLTFMPCASEPLPLPFRQVLPVGAGEGRRKGRRRHRARGARTERHLSEREQVEGGRERVEISAGSWGRVRMQREKWGRRPGHLRSASAPLTSCRSGTRPPGREADLGALHPRSAVPAAASGRTLRLGPSGGGLPHLGPASTPAASRRGGSAVEGGDSPADSGHHREVPSLGALSLSPGPHRRPPPVAWDSPSRLTG